MPKRKSRNTAHKRKTIRYHRLFGAVVVLLIAAGGFVSTLAWYGISYGAIVDFSFGGSNNVRASYQLFAISPLRLPTIDNTHVFIRNIGSAGITVLVTVHAVNAVVSSGYYTYPYTDTAQTQIYLAPGLGYLITFYLFLPMQASTFTLQVTAARTLDFSSITALATSSFSPIHPSSPTTLIYEETQPNSTAYVLTQQD